MKLGMPQFMREGEFAMPGIQAWMKHDHWLSEIVCRRSIDVWPEVCVQDIDAKLVCDVVEVSTRGTRVLLAECSDFVNEPLGAT
jgi:hypothetical protein